MSRGFRDVGGFTPHLPGSQAPRNPRHPLVVSIQTPRFYHRYSQTSRQPGFWRNGIQLSMIPAEPKGLCTSCNRAVDLDADVCPHCNAPLEYGRHAAFRRASPGQFESRASNPHTVLPIFDMR